MTKQNTPEQSELQRLPDCPEIALFLTGVMQQLGCTLDIGNYFPRSVSYPVCMRVLPNGRPQLNDPLPHETFHSDEEVRGATKLLSYFFDRLSDRDADFVFTLFARVNLGNMDAFDFREHIKRVQ